MTAWDVLAFVVSGGLIGWALVEAHRNGWGK